MKSYVKENFQTIDSNGNRVYDSKKIDDYIKKKQDEERKCLIEEKGNEIEEGEKMEINPDEIAKIEKTDDEKQIYEINLLPNMVIGDYPKHLDGELKADEIIASEQKEQDKGQARRLVPINKNQINDSKNGFTNVLLLSLITTGFVVLITLLTTLFIK